MFMLRRGLSLIIRRHMSTPVAPPAAAEPPSKSSLKKAEKLAAAAARKSLKEVITAATGLAQPVVGGGKKKEKPVVAVVEELPFIEVPEGHKKGQSSYYIVCGDAGGLRNRFDSFRQSFSFLNSPSTPSHAITLDSSYRIIPICQSSLRGMHY